MSADPLFTTRLKIDRAKKHFDELNASVEAFKAGNPYEVVVDNNLSTRSKVYRLHIATEVPSSWAGTIGDIIHNLRASLDCLATSLVIANGFKSKTALSNAYFPISRTLEGLGNFGSFFQLVSPKVEKLVRRIEPYEGGKGDAVWLLHELDLLDRHRGLIPVGVRLPEIILTFPTLLGSDLLIAELPPLPLKIAKPLHPLKEGDLIFRSEVGPGLRRESDPNAYLAFEVAFGEGQVVDGEPLLPKLKQLINVTERIVDLFDRRIFQHP
jgi:hypothetical protein